MLLTLLILREVGLRFGLPALATLDAIQASATASRRLIINA